LIEECFVGLQRRLIYFRLPAQVPPAEAVAASAREVTLGTVGCSALGAWLVEADEPDRGVAVLMANGNAGKRSVRAPLARALASAGLAVLLFDYRGFGGNAGRPSEQGLARDVRAARRLLIEKAEVAPACLLYYGETRGSAVVTELATEHPPAGFVLRSPLVDLASAVRARCERSPVERGRAAFDKRGDFGSVMPILLIGVRCRAIGWVCKPEVVGSSPARSISRNL
jgi:uncharacterized protein